MLLSKFVAGRVLAYSVYTPSGELLLPKGAVLNERIRLMLARWGVTEVYAEDESPASKATLRGKPPIPAPVDRAYRQAVDQIREAMKSLRVGRGISAAELVQTCGDLVMSIASAPDIVTYLHLLRYRDDYTFQHSIRVGVLSALMAKWLRLPPGEQRQVAAAGALHDLGKAMVPLEILNKPGRLTPDELAFVRSHPMYGYDLLVPECGTDSILSRVALEHHERMDGSGYPQGLRGQQAALSSRIVAVADVYDAMTSDRVYRRRQPRYAVLAELQECGFYLLDPQVTGIFVERLAQQAHGREVRLSDGRTGRVVFITGDSPARPIVRVEQQLIDLRQHRHLRLVGESEPEPDERPVVDPSDTDHPQR